MSIWVNLLQEYLLPAHGISSVQSHWPHPPGKSDILALQGTDIHTPGVWMLPSDLTHTPGSLQGEGFNLHCNSTVVRSSSCSAPALGVCKTQPDFDLTQLSVWTKICILHFTGKIQSSASGGQACCLPVPRNICWLPRALRRIGRKDPCQAHLFPGRFIQAVLVKQTRRRIILSQT